jgi:hypothetical protein
LLAAGNHHVVHAEIIADGAEFIVNSYTPRSQSRPDVAALSDGGFVIVWESDHTGIAANDIVVRTFDASGNPTQTDFRVNGYAHGLQVLPAVTGAADGKYLVVWVDSERDLVAGKLLKRRVALTPDLEVTFDDSPYLVRRPDVTTMANGSFVVTWNGYEDGLPFPANAVLTRRFDNTGEAIGQTSRVTELDVGIHAAPALARLNGRDVLVTWVNEQSILAKRFDTVQSNLGNELPVASDVVFAGPPSLAVDSDGDIVVVWESRTDILGQRFDIAFEPLGTEFRVNTYTLATQRRPVVSFDGTGGFMVVWSSFDSHGPGQDGSSNGVFAREYAPDGTPETEDFLVNTTTQRSQENPSIAFIPPSRLVVAWESQGQDGQGSAIVAQRFTVSDATTTTTPQSNESCGDPAQDDGSSSGFGASAVITVADALFVLRSAVGAESCALCICDVDGSGNISATDAVQVLQHALGGGGALECPPCAP